MIKLEIPIDKIPYARQIEGRKFKEGFWYFPESSLPKLQQLNLCDSSLKLQQQKHIEYNLSNHLRQYQHDIVNKVLNNNSYGIFADTGTGKTVMGLEIADKFNKVLIVCPLSIIDNAWIADCHKFHPNKNIVSLWDKSKQKRIQLLKSNADIYVINYEGLQIIMNEILDKKFDCIIVDESSKMKNHKSRTSQSLLKLKECIPHRVVLSGCPCPNHNSEIFSQMKFIDENIFGNNYYGFLARYFHQDMTNPHKWYQTEEDKEKYFSKLSDKCVFLKKEDCVELPEKTFIVRQFDLSKGQQKQYDLITKEIKDNIDSWTKFKFKSKLMKLREVLSGFVIQDKDTIEFTTNKDDELESTINEIGDKPIIIWCQFKHEIERLSKKFNGVGLTSETKNRNQIIEDFKDNKIKLLFVHPKLLGMGLTFVNCTYNIYYSLSFSYEEFKQSQDRIHRIGQENKCTYIILQGKNTIDEKIYTCLKQKKNIVDELYLELGIKVN